MGGAASIHEDHKAQIAKTMREEYDVLKNEGIPDVEIYNRMSHKYTSLSTISTPSLIKRLESRRAVKSFMHVPPADFNIQPILDAILLAPTSYGIQPFSVKVVSNPEIKTALTPVSYGQRQVAECTYLLVFVARNDASIMAERYIAINQLDKYVPPYAEMIRGMVGSKTEAAMVAWARAQAYIALGFGLAAAAYEGAASCPMEGFDPTGVSSVLGLGANEIPVAYLAVGVANPNEKEANPHPKFRFPESELIVQDEVKPFHSTDTAHTHNISQFIEKLKSRRAIKSFKSLHSSDVNVKPLLDAVRLAPTSNGIQPFMCRVVSSKEKKEALRAVSYDQRQVTECTYLLVFTARNDSAQLIERYFKSTELEKHAPEYAAQLKGMLISKTSEEMTQWSKAQAYIALSFALVTAAEASLASCPMEGFDPTGVSSVLGLGANEIPVAYLAVGGQNEDEKEANPYPKFRFPEGEIIQKI